MGRPSWEQAAQVRSQPSKSAFCPSRGAAGWPAPDRPLTRAAPQLERAASVELVSELSAEADERRAAAAAEARRRLAVEAELQAHHAQVPAPA